MAHYCENSIQEHLQIHNKNIKIIGLDVKEYITVWFHVYEIQEKAKLISGEVRILVAIGRKWLRGDPKEPFGYKKCSTSW